MNCVSTVDNNTLCISKIITIIHCSISWRLKNKQPCYTNYTDCSVHIGNAFTHRWIPCGQRASQMKSQIWGKCLKRNVFLRNQTVQAVNPSSELEWWTRAGKQGTPGQYFQGKRRMQLHLPLALAATSSGKREEAGQGTPTYLPLEELPPPKG